MRCIDVKEFDSSVRPLCDEPKVCHEYSVMDFGVRANILEMTSVQRPTSVHNAFVGVVAVCCCFILALEAFRHLWNQNGWKKYRLSDCRVASVAVDLTTIGARWTACGVVVLF